MYTSPCTERELRIGTGSAKEAVGMSCSSNEGSTLAAVVEELNRALRRRSLLLLLRNAISRLLLYVIIFLFWFNSYSMSCTSRWIWVRWLSLAVIDKMIRCELCSRPFVTRLSSVWPLSFTIVFRWGSQLINYIGLYCDLHRAKVHKWIISCKPYYAARCRCRSYSWNTTEHNRRLSKPLDVTSFNALLNAYNTYFYTLGRFSSTPATP